MECLDFYLDLKSVIKFFKNCDIYSTTVSVRLTQSNPVQHSGSLMCF